MSFPRRRESSNINELWIPAYARMTNKMTFYETINFDCLITGAHPETVFSESRSLVYRQTLTINIKSILQKDAGKQDFFGTDEGNATCFYGTNDSRLALAAWYPRSIASSARSKPSK